MKWIDIIETASGTKTKMFTVWTVDHSTLLGEIRFYPRWRKYAFYPANSTLYEQDCLRDIAKFCEDRTTFWRASLKNKVQPA